MTTELDKQTELIRRWIAFSNSGFAGKVEDFISAIEQFCGQQPERPIVESSRGSRRRIVPWNSQVLVVYRIHGKIAESWTKSIS